MYIYIHDNYIYIYIKDNFLFDNSKSTDWEPELQVYMCVCIYICLNK